MRKLIIISFIIIQFVPSLHGQEWVVPENRKSRLSPFPFTDDSRKKGETSYTVNCVSCHGNPGKGNIIDLVPPPPDPATEKVQKNNDGEIYYKIAEGRLQMPAFKNVLTSNEIWNLVAYIRSFNRSYKQSVMPVITSAAYPGADIKINLAYIPAEAVVEVRAVAVKEAIAVPVVNAAVKLFIFRTFGMLPVGEEQITDNEGIAKFNLSENTPGDTSGNLRLSAKFSDEDVFGAFSRDTILMAGNKTFPVSLVAERAMWNRASKAPVWIIVTFTGGLLAVWSFILLIMLKLRDLYIIGSTLLKQEKQKSDELS
jgi:mono/diheme cytochrome c family protein